MYSIAFNVIYNSFKVKSIISILIITVIYLLKGIHTVDWLRTYKTQSHHRTYPRSNHRRHTRTRGGVAGIQNQAGGHNLFRLVKLPAKIQFAPDDPDNLNLTTH